ncbi:MAG: glucose-6-phosphate isomerase [Bacteroidetes bacterium]|nr:glucose-6-phosphate isomerase [Bacteroidota bacterium]
MHFDPGMDIMPQSDPLGFTYGPGIFGPHVETRSLDSIRWSLLDPACAGPDPVYAIAMDVGKEQHRSLLIERNLLFGVVTYASGKLGREPVRSRGHAHIRKAGRKLASPEIYEIWSGKAVIYMQELSGDDPGRCFAVEAGPGDVVIVPPDWTHAAISADTHVPLTFGAWCDRDSAFDYDKIRRHGGPAWFPVLSEKHGIDWLPNKNYRRGELIEKKPSNYSRLRIERGKSIYKTFEEDPDAFMYVPNPEMKSDLWKDFTP